MLPHRREPKYIRPGAKQIRSTHATGAHGGPRGAVQGWVNTSTARAALLVPPEQKLRVMPIDQKLVPPEQKLRVMPIDQKLVPPEQKLRVMPIDQKLVPPEQKLRVMPIDQKLVPPEQKLRMFCLDKVKPSHLVKVMLGISQKEEGFAKRNIKSK
jgi:hypothetical protein